MFKEFVFLDQDYKPFYVRDWGGEPWLFYWHPHGKWVSLRRADSVECNIMSNFALSEEEANHYHNKHRQTVGDFV